MSISSVTTSSLSPLPPHAADANKVDGTRTTMAEAPTASATETRARRSDNASPERLVEIVEQAQHKLESIARDITFSFNDKADTVVVKVIERESKEVIRQIPSEEFLKLAEQLNESIDKIRTGLLVQQEA